MNSKKIEHISHFWLQKNLCNYHGYVMSLIGIVTHLLVCAMAIERLLGIRHGYFYNQNVTTYRVKWVLVKLGIRHSYFYNQNVTTYRVKWVLVKLGIRHSYFYNQNVTYLQIKVSIS